MPVLLSFEPRYHELTCRDGQPVWVPVYNPMRECVGQECLRIRATGGEVETRVSHLPTPLRRAVSRTKNAQRYAKVAPVLEPMYALLMVLCFCALVLLACCLLGISLAMALDQAWFATLSRLQAFAVSLGAGLAVMCPVMGFLTRSWWRCATAH